MIDRGRVFELVIRAAADPIERQGLKGRADVYRFKILVKIMLRKMGFVVVDHRTLPGANWWWDGPGDGI